MWIKRSMDRAIGLIFATFHMEGGLMKKYIYSITPNPALDISGTVENLVPNEKSYVHNVCREPGGNGINAARIISRLGCPVVVSGFLGGATGDEILSLLIEEKLSCDFLRIRNGSRFNITISNNHDHLQTRLTFPGPLVEKKERDLLEKKVSKLIKEISLLIIGGSVTSNTNTRYIERIMSLANNYGVPCVIDCPAPTLAKLINFKPVFIKPNLTEFQLLTHSSVKSIKAVKKAAEKLLIKVPRICISSVEGGALLVTKENTYFGRIPKVKIRSTVGAGDSMVGAICAQLYKKNVSNEDLLRWGLAASASTLSQVGTKLGNAKDIAELYRLTFVTKID